MPVSTHPPPGIRAWRTGPRGMVCKILPEHMKRRDPEFETMAEILCAPASGETA
ncbi:MAG: hypothetical protein J2P48_02225 [Alphaproteobacteria bacterium]|nr:hypothetical protein [Alphaproteobacteria bacterium]